MDVSKNEEKQNTVFLNSLKPEESASRLGEKQILTKLTKNKVGFQETAISENGVLV